MLAAADSRHRGVHRIDQLRWATTEHLGAGGVGDQRRDVDHAVGVLRDQPDTIGEERDQLGAEREVPNRARNADKLAGQAVVVDLPYHCDEQGPLGGHKGERRSRDTERDVDTRPQRAVNLDRPAAARPSSAPSAAHSHGASV